VDIYSFVLNKAVLVVCFSETKIIILPVHVIFQEKFLYKQTNYTLQKTFFQFTIFFYTCFTANKHALILLFDQQLSWTSFQMSNSIATGSGWENQDVANR